MTMPDHVTKTQLDDFIERALKEDIPEEDYTTLACIPADSKIRAQLLVKDVGVIAGVEIAEQIFKNADESAVFQSLLKDGTAVRFGQVAFQVECNTRALLKVERLVLNIMQRMSGIASLSNRFLFEVEDLPVIILDTRKTTPLVRFLEKWAVRLGGCQNYRYNLSDWIMIKDNHVDACGGIRQAIEKVVAFQKEKGMKLRITVEVRNLVELYEVLKVGQINRIMLDNFELPLLKEAVAIVGGRFETEASGGITINTVRKTAQTGVDYISVGALTHSAQSLDLSLKIV